MSQLANAFTVDVEDYFQVTAFERVVSRSDWGRHQSRVVANTQCLLELLARHNVSATFFVLGWVAERFPQLVREIHAAGHELGSHSHWHHLVYRMNPGEFREDLRRSLAVIEDAAGCRVKCYRAPSFSITSSSLWALEILVEEGIEIDSSIFPIYHDRYGIPSAQRRLHQLSTPAGKIWEFPPSVARFARLNLPVSGGGYFRLFPAAFTRACLRSINRSADEPFMFYIHPWEIDPEQPRVKAGSRMARWRHYVNLAQTHPKLESLLTSFQFAPLGEIVASKCPLSDNGSPALVLEEIG